MYVCITIIYFVLFVFTKIICFINVLIFKKLQSTSLLVTIIWFTIYDCYLFGLLTRHLGQTNFKNDKKES